MKLSKNLLDNEANLRQLKDLITDYRNAVDMGTGIIGITYSTIHLDTESFNKYFGDLEYNTINDWSSAYPYYFSYDLNGVEYMCISKHPLPIREERK